MNASAKTTAAEAVLDAYLASAPNSINANAQQAAVKQLAKLPVGMDPEKLVRVFKRLGPLRVLSFCGKLPEAYLPQLTEAVRSYANDTTQSRMVLHCLLHALENDIGGPGGHEAYMHTVAFLQYVDKFQFPVEKAEHYAKSDPYVTAAAVKHIAHTLCHTEYGTRDARVFNSFV